MVKYVFIYVLVNDKYTQFFNDKLKNDNNKKIK